MNAEFCKKEAISREDHRWLFMVNAGSSEISSCAVKKNGIELIDVVDSCGYSIDRNGSVTLPDPQAGLPTLSVRRRWPITQF